MAQEPREGSDPPPPMSSRGTWFTCHAPTRQRGFELAWRNVQGICCELAAHSGQRPAGRHNRVCCWVHCRDALWRQASCIGES